MNLQGQWNKPLFTTDQSAGKLFSISLSEHEFLLVFLFVFVSPWDIQLFPGVLSEGSQGHYAVIYYHNSRHLLHISVPIETSIYSY